MLSRSEVENRLILALNLANAEFQQAKRDFKSTMDDVPSAIPQPDSNRRVESAGERYRTAMRAYTLALCEFNGFVASGKIPDRFLDEPQSE
jgi:hypothetical protein